MVSVAVFAGVRIADESAVEIGLNTEVEVLTAGQ